MGQQKYGKGQFVSFSATSTIFFFKYMRVFKQIKQIVEINNNKEFIKNHALNLSYFLCILI